MDARTGDYNRPFLTPALDLIPGYCRMQDIVFRKGDQRFEGHSAADAIATALADPGCLMVSRNAGSGTRILIDGLLKDARPPGYWSQPKSHKRCCGLGGAEAR
jgi:putative molybdopterin biosynthesis protein